MDALKLQYRRMVRVVTLATNALVASPWLTLSFAKNRSSFWNDGDNAGSIVPGIPSRGIVDHDSHVAPNKPPHDPKPAVKAPAGDATEGEDKKDDKEEEEDKEDEAPPFVGFFPERLHKLGPVNSEVIYTGEGFNLARGGVTTRNATRYRGNLDVVLTLDTAAANWWQGGEFFVYGSHTHGKTLIGDFTQDYQLYSNIDSVPYVDLNQVSEYWYRHTFAGKKLTLKIGKQDANADFCFPDLGAEFVNSSFQVPVAMPLPTWPNQPLGISAFYKPTEKWEVLGGVLDGSADGRTWGFSTFSQNGMFLIGQVNYKFQAQEKARHPGTWRVGTWLHTGKFDNQAVPDEQVAGNYGAYIVADQMLIPEESPAQGLGFFTMLSWAPSDRNIIDQNLAFGLVYKGLLEGRDDDIVGLGVTTVEFNKYQRSFNGLSQETAVELYYRYQLTPWAAIQPDVQYIANPSGSGVQVQDALLFGLRCQLIL